MIQPNPYYKLQADLRDIFSNELRHYKQSQEIYRSFCNTVWEKDGYELSYSWRAAGEMLANIRNSLQLEIGNPDVCEICGKAKKDHIVREHTIIPFWSEEKVALTTLLCYEGSDNWFISEYDGPEDYMDFYCSGREGEVPTWVENKMKEAGYRRS